MVTKTPKQIGTRRWALEVEGDEDAARDVPVYRVPAGQSAVDTAKALGLQLLLSGAAKGRINDVCAIISDIDREWRAVKA